MLANERGKKTGKGKIGGKDKQTEKLHWRGGREEGKEKEGANK